MRSIRLLVYFAIGLVLGGLATLSHAETINATLSTSHYKWVNTSWCSYFGQPCAAADGLPWETVNKAVADKMAQQNAATCTTYYPEPAASSGNNGCTCLRYDNVTMQCATGGAVRGGALYECPTGQNWTLSGTTCTRPDCPSGETRQSDGSCLNPCASKANTSVTTQFKVTGDGTAVGGSTCDGGCAATVSKKGEPAYTCSFGAGGLGICFETIGYTLSYSGQVCTGAPPAPPASEAPQVNSHKPKCNAGEGVLTSTSGTVACVPAGTPDTSTPVVKTSTKTETYPDATTKTTTTTTTTDPKSGASDITSTVVSTGGQSGTAGTTSSNEVTGNSSGASGGDGTCDPKKDFCGGPGTGGLYAKKTKTMQSVMQSFKDGVSASPIGQAATGFLTVSTPGGTCPHWVASVAWFNWSLDLGQYFCTAEAITFLNLFGVVIFAVVSFTAFKWAIL